jgi:hypothetical protein
MCRTKKKRVSIYVDSESYDLIAGITTKVSGDRSESASPYG